MTDDIPTPYDNPWTLWERLVYPLAAEAYRGGAEDASDLGTSALQLGIRDADELMYMVKLARGTSHALLMEARRHQMNVDRIMSKEEL